MKKISDVALSFVLRWVGRICAHLPLKGRIIIGDVIGYILKFASSKRYAITLENLREAWPEKSHSWHRHIALSSYRNLGIVLAEILSFQYLTNEKLIDFIEFTNLELLHSAYRNNKGMILLSGHFGNWELLAFAAGLYSDIPLHIVVAPQHNPYANEYINVFRTRSTNKIVPMTNAAREIVKLLQEGKAVAMLTDQAANASKNIFVDFFRRPAPTYEAPAALALKFQIPLIIGFAVRQPSGKYSVTLESIPYDDLTYSKDGIVELTARHVKILEDVIRLHPEQWSWQHKRWKI